MRCLLNILLVGTRTHKEVLECIQLAGCEINYDVMRISLTFEFIARSKAVGMLMQLVQLGLGEKFVQEY